MSLDRKYSIYRKIAVFVAINFLVEIFAPTVMFALTGGPASPEFSSFEPVATTNMVSEFSGDLTYNLPVINVPGVNGGGYAMSLSYHSGTTPEEESSWVGYGWTLNPGAINRGKKGFPDDWDGTTTPVKYHNQSPANQTVAVGGSVGNLELFSFNAPVSANASIRYNNYRGFGYTIGAGISLAKGVVSLGYSVSDGTGSFSLSLNPANALKGDKEKGEKGDKKAKQSAKEKKAARIKKATDRYNARTAEGVDKKTAAGGSTRGALASLGSGYGLHNFASANRPTQIVGYTGISTTVSLNVLLAPTPLQAGVTVGAFGSYSRQKNDPEENNLNAYGYMYSANAGTNDMMDYFVEKGSTYNKQDKFLGIPFNNADNYALTGEGLSGGFKLQHRKVGRFHPNYIKSTTNIFNVTPEIEVGLNYGGGGDIGVGKQTLEIEEWESATNNGFSSGGDEDVFFRFANDKGGQLSYDGGNVVAKKANLQFTNSLPGSKSVSTNTSHITTSIKTDDNDYARSLRSSYIGYNTNAEIGTTEGGIQYKTYAKGANSHVNNGTIDRSSSNQIGEFSIVNEDGNRYNYGVPVLSKNEKNLQVDLIGVNGSQIENKFLVYRDITGTTKTKVGEERDAPYATSYLLTGITSPDYIDRKHDGPTDDDFGGYTKFTYNRAYGGTGSWYKWRMPYAGLSYSRNELSNPKDDLGSVAEGEKEIYYLETVETKTHYAVFYTSLRNDGFDANGSPSTASTNSGAQGSHALKKLDKIELFVKNNSGGTDKKIKTVHFEYDYSLNQGVLNNTAGTGKLTLKRVWFEYNGTVSAKISPYQFEYAYPTTAQADYPTRYDYLENYGAGLNENPNYSPFNIDAWGNYQANGAARFADMKTWLNQDEAAASVADFDPAAWQLKVIKLPSGGEIHVQYEQDDYCYVQDKAAQAMVSLTNSGSNHNNGTFIINTAELGITTAADRQKLAGIIKKEYVNGSKKMYFKMLYKLLGGGTPGLNDCNVEYVTGYADVSSVTAVGNGIEVKLKSNGYSLPKQVCEDYVTTQRAGNLSSIGSNCDPSDGVIGGADATEKVLAFAGQAAAWLASLAPGTTCLEVNYPYSYLKIPILNAKKGGGVRVKRLLMYDKGIDTGVPVLYGSEYIYKTFDDDRKEFRSSGVATNEPGSIREENALVGFLPRFKQGFLGKIVSGRDKKQSEGPLGESLLPGASVGYSKITTKSIHSGKTNPGFAVKEFYTAKDYPFKMKMTELDRNKKDYLPLITGLINKTTNNAWVSQGYAFEINSMHGQVKSSSTYAGDYSDILNPSSSLLISQEVMTYFQPGEELPILNPKDLSILPAMPLGKEMDMVMESKAVKDINVDGNVEFDADVGIFGIIIFPFLSAFPSLSFSETELYTHTTSKVTTYPAIVKSTKSYADGIYHVTENVAFNPETGQPIMTKTTDGFDDLDLIASTNHDGTYTNYTFPASLEYENVSQKAKNERKLITSTSSVSIDKIVEGGKAYLSFSAVPPAQVCDAMSNFVGGDLIKIPSGVYHTGDVVGSKMEIQPTNYSSLGASSSAIDVEIIRSGRTNQLNESVGGITTYGNTSTVITPMDPLVLAQRQTFASLLTNSLLNGTTIYPSDIPAGIEFVNPDGSCSPLSQDQFIRLEGNMVNIYGPGSQPGQSIVVIPNHPMVDALNDYMDMFWNYNLGPEDKARLKCEVDIGALFGASNFLTDVANMRNAQNSFLSQIFANVNGGTYAINNLLVDDGVALGQTTGISDGSGFLNKRVVLEEITSGKKMGAYWNCEGYCSGCEAPESGQFICGQEEPEEKMWFFSQTSDGYLTYFNEEYPYGDIDPCITDIRFYKIEEGEAQPEIVCSSPIEMAGPLMSSSDFGHFDVDATTGALVYFAADNNCNSQDIPCLRFCSNIYASTAITNVVASNASTMSDWWEYDVNDYLANGSLIDNDYERGARGKWRTDRTFAFKTEVDRLSTGYDKNYNSGTYNLELFDWQNLGANGNKWLELNKVTQYSPNGNALEEQNILGIKSAAKFGYHKTLAYMMAQNASFNSIAFESFENTYGVSPISLEDGVQLTTSDGTIDNSESHSGNSSFKLQFPANDGVELSEMIVNSQILAEGMLFKVWVKTDFHDRTVLGDHLKAELLDVNNSQFVSENFEKVAQVGGWYLYEAKIPESNFIGMSVGDALKTFVKYEFTNHGSENVWIDDVRIQPMDAQATTYVYDVVTHRLITSFDDQHFGLFYQYNGEGKLVRKLIETERGMKTVQETQYNTPKIPRN